MAESRSLESLLEYYDKTGVVRVEGQLVQLHLDLVRSVLIRAELEGRRKVTIQLDSNGGELDLGYSIGGAIAQSGLEVECVVTNRAHSAGLLVLLHCYPRIARPNATFMFHWGFAQWSNSNVDLMMTSRDESSQDEVKAIYTTLVDLMVHKTKLNRRQVYQLARQERTLCVTEALQFGIVDRVLPW